MSLASYELQILPTSCIATKKCNVMLVFIWKFLCGYIFAILGQIAIDKVVHNQNLFFTNRKNIFIYFIDLQNCQKFIHSKNISRFLVLRYDIYSYRHDLSHLSITKYLNYNHIKQNRYLKMIMVMCSF